MCWSIFLEDHYHGKGSKSIEMKISMKKSNRRRWLLLLVNFVKDIQVFIHSLLSDEFALYLKYVKELGFEESPNYDNLRKLFKDLLNKTGEVNDCIFDWKTSNNHTLKKW